MLHDAPRTMTRRRRLLATSHDKRYAYYLDVKDLYVYQLRLVDMCWAGWLCTLAAWERTFIPGGAFDAA